MSTARKVCMFLQACIMAGCAQHFTAAGLKYQAPYGWNVTSEHKVEDFEEIVYSYNRQSVSLTRTTRPFSTDLRSVVEAAKFSAGGRNVITGQTQKVVCGHTVLDVTLYTRRPYSTQPLLVAHNVYFGDNNNEISISYVRPFSEPDLPEAEASLRVTC